MYFIGMHSSKIRYNTIQVVMHNHRTYKCNSHIHTGATSANDKLTEEGLTSSVVESIEPKHVYIQKQDRTP